MIRIHPLRLRLSPLRRFVPAQAFESQGQPLLAVEPVNALMIIPPAIPPEHDVNPAITIVDPSFGDFPDTQAQYAVICRHRTVAERNAADPQRKTDLLLAGSVACLQIPSPFAQARQRQFFFASTSCSMVLSRLRSATSFFRLRFSSSSCRICFTSEGEMPPYFLRHVQKVASVCPACDRRPARTYPVQPASRQKQSALR